MSAGRLKGLRVAKYRRISDDDEGKELGITRQDEDLDAFIEQEGGTCVGDYVDNDLGASTRSKKPRPDFKRLLVDARLGKFDAIASYTSSRLTRHPRENEDLIELAERHGIRYAYIRSPSFDLNTADGRNVARILAANDAAEAERIAERVARAALQRAQQGLASGGHRPFGFETPRGPLNDAEATLVRKAADRLLAGDYNAHIVREWNDAGILTPRGARWAPNSFKTMITSPRIAGLSLYHKVPLLDADGNYIVAEWPAILDVETWEAVCALYDERKGRKPYRTHLLSGIVRCAKCSRPMYGGGQERRPGRHDYRCQLDKGGCGKSSISGMPTDLLVAEWVERKLDGESVETPAPEWDGEQELRDAEAQKQELWAAWKGGVMEGALAFPEIQQIEDRIRRLTRERAAARKSQLPPSDLRTRWREGDVLLRREIVKQLLVAVVIHPAWNSNKSGPVFDYRRVDPIER